ncbi:carbon-nitrogen family hydrolase [Haloarcula sediminis]|uniref:carbon-nitrogen family hydrolase n=1 Tax=Haloarcula sediminis TaxID=3111777 RepID=UPI002D794868|nr:carbon-nitrogen family hydrolase [Haloarcula sp. CK38]
MKLGLAQITVEPGAVAANRRRATEAVERAADADCDLVVLPELFTVGYFAFEAYQRNAEGLDGGTVTALRSVAAERDIGILAGSFVEDLELSAAAGHDVPESEGLANTSVFLDREGTRKAVYRKHHLFGYDSAESDLLVAGESLPTVEFGGFTVGVTTCYDLRFPELYRRLVEAGATLVVVPSAWPYPRVEHWQLLPRARAVENQCYVAAANGVGRFDDAELLGRSTVYDPWGTTLASSDDDPALVTADIRPETVADVREEFPALADRR